MKRLAIVVIGVAVLAGGFHAAYVAGYLPPAVTDRLPLGQAAPVTDLTAAPGAEPAAAPAQQDTEESAPAEPAIAGARVVADAKVVPIERADLSMRLPGIVKEVLVQEGARVEAGQVLVKLDAALQQVAVAQATGAGRATRATSATRLAGGATGANGGA